MDFPVLGYPRFEQCSIGEAQGTCIHYEVFFLFPVKDSGRLRQVTALDHSRITRRGNCVEACGATQQSGLGRESNSHEAFPQVDDWKNG